MTDLRRILGTVFNQFRIGINGPMIKQHISASRLAVRNVADTEFRQMQGADPVEPQDYLTKAFHDAAIGLLVPFSRQILTEEGIKGGGDLTADRTLSLDIPGLAAELAMADDDSFVFYDDDANIHKRITLADFLAAVAPVETSAVLEFGNTSVGSSTTTRYLSPGAQSGTATTTQIGRMCAPRAGTLRSLHVRHNSPAGNGNNVVYTVLVNGAPTALMATLASTGMKVSDIVNTVAVVQGDDIEVRVTKGSGIGSGLLEAIATMELGA